MPLIRVKFSALSMADTSVPMAVRFFFILWRIAQASFIFCSLFIFGLIFHRGQVALFSALFGMPCPPVNGWAQHPVTQTAKRAITQPIQRQLCI
jgi:hypothetical protein